MSMELHDAWRQIRGDLRADVGERTYGLWLKPLRCDGLQGGTLLLSGPPEVSAWAADRLSAVIQRAVTTVLGPGVAVQIRPAGAAPRSRRQAPP